jgi:phage terminase large subunit-like protein
MLRLIAAEKERRSRNKIDSFFPEQGQFRRELYKPHLEFFAAGAKYRTRVFLAGNRTGKTIAGAYELTLHLTGVYPHWWVGKRFDKPIRAVAASDTGKTTREVIQQELLGQPGRFGTGMVPYDLLEKSTMRSGVTDAVDTCYIKYASGGFSTLIFKSYEQKRESFQGLSLEFGWLDEECPEQIFDETLTRMATTGGLLALTFTPLQGLTPLIQRFLPGGISTAD